MCLRYRRALKRKCFLITLGNLCFLGAMCLFCRLKILDHITMADNEGKAKHFLAEHFTILRTLRGFTLNVYFFDKHTNRLFPEKVSLHKTRLKKVFSLNQLYGEHLAFRFRLTIMLIQPTLRTFKINCVSVIGMNEPTRAGLVLFAQFSSLSSKSFLSDSKPISLNPAFFDPKLQATSVLLAGLLAGLPSWGFLSRLFSIKIVLHLLKSGRNAD